MNLDQLIEAARLAYYRHDQKVVINEPPRYKSNMDMIRPSGFSCALKHAYEKTGLGNPIEWLLADNNVAITDTMQQGNKMAELYQESLYYWYLHNGGDPEVDDQWWEVIVERPIISHELGMNGQIDTLIKTPDNEMWVVEMKYTMSGSKHDPGEPRYSHMLQTLSYMMMVKKEYPNRIVRGFIITIGKGHPSRKAWDVWELERYGNGYRLYNTRSQEPLKVNYGDDWNDGSVSEETITSNIEEMKRWIDDVAWGNVQAPYIADYDHHPQGWMCVEQKKPTKRTPGYVAPRCPFAGTCHGVWETKEIPHEDTE